MFSGIVEQVGRVLRLSRQGQALTLTVAVQDLLGDAKPGDSIAVNGVCLTIRDLDRDTRDTASFTADVMPETMRVTNLGGLAASEEVNLERALRLGDRVGGHLVTGHVDGTGRLLSRRREDNAFLLRIAAPPEVAPYLTPRGSIAVDGVSLTVARCHPDSFEVAIIPHTAARTTLGRRRPGDILNLEGDMIAKQVVHWVETRYSGKVKP